MQQTFAQMLAIGGKLNSLGIAGEVVEVVLQDKTRLEELYLCTSNDDAWVRMRAIDSIEKVCRVHPDWLLSYVDRLNTELAVSDQASIRWHLAQIYGEVTLSPSQKQFALNWLKEMISTPQVDWIVAANTMNALAKFAREGSVDKDNILPLFEIQLQHKSNAVVKRANKLINELS